MCVKKRETTLNGEQVVAVLSPYNPVFVARAKRMGAKWCASSKEWAFPIGAQAHVDDMVFEIYGEQFGVKTETVTLKVTFTEDEYEYHDGIVIAGRSIAYATGRDSGAKIGDKVSFIVGGPTSGGSVKNWSTRIKAGSVVEIYDVALPAAERELADPTYSTLQIEIIKPEKTDDSKAKLLAEKESLLKRLAEIELEESNQ